jgi:hypothetical protein
MSVSVLRSSYYILLNGSYQPKTFADLAAASSCYRTVVVFDLRETALGYFGFDSSLYGTKKNVVTRKL